MSRKSIRSKSPKNSKKQQVRRQVGPILGFFGVTLSIVIISGLGLYFAGHDPLPYVGSFVLGILYTLGYAVKKF